MGMFRRLAMLCALAAAGIPAGAAADAITAMEVSPPAPAVLAHGAQVTVTFVYDVTQTRGVRIFARPMSHGAPAPNYAASGSKVYERGSGRGRAQFTIRSGEADIDGVRFQIVDAVSRDILSERVFPVRFRFSANPMALCPEGPQDEAKSVVGRSVAPDGSVEISFSDGSKTIYHPGGGFTTVLPDGTMIIASAIMIMPTPPPAETSAPDSVWMASMNDWLGGMSEAMLNDIEVMAGDPQSFANYQALEAAETATLYERLEMRRRFLSLLSR